MLRIKRLYTFILQTFLPVFCMTFLICLFIVLMQFLWKYVDELVGKGLEVSVIGELFFYAALSMVPMALPLAVLLASLMSFGGLAERLELLAMKAAGVSLIKIMRPLIIFITFVAIAGFYFQDQILPKSQVKLWTLLYSVRHKSPELDIPEGIFYKEIQGYNIYVKKKNRDTGILYDVTIYDVSGSFEDVTVIKADSGHMRMGEDKRHLFLTLWSGESFQNLNEQKRNQQNVPYQRETFTRKDISIEFDANFNRMDESIMSNQYIGKDMVQLNHSIDSLRVRKDSIAGGYSGYLIKSAYFRGHQKLDTTLLTTNAPVETYRIDSLYNSLTLKSKQELINKALIKANSIKQDYEFKAAVQKDEEKSIRRHEIELQRKFSYSLACLVFFFIGAPLGAIIGKGGLGMPVIISVLLFIVYYIIDNTGYKMARDGQLDVLTGVWLSTMVLLPMGIFFTYKAMHDSALFNSESYLAVIREVIGIQKQRKFVLKEVIIETLNKPLFAGKINEFSSQCENYIKESTEKGSANFINFFTGKKQPHGLDEIVVNYNILLEEGSNAADQSILKLLSKYPVLFKLEFSSPVKGQIPGYIVAICLPFSIPYYILAMFKRKKRIQNIQQVISYNKELVNLLGEK